MYKCTNCKWEGEVLSIEPVKGKCLICGDNVIVTDEVIPNKVAVKEEIKVNLDLNNDGKVDDKDASIASKVMNKVRHKSKKKKGKR